MRIILTLILALSVSFACNQRYEEVEGIKIGCPLESTKGLTVLDKQEEKGVIIYEKQINGLFDTASLFVADGQIEGLTLKRTRAYDPSLFDELMLRLDDKWGDQRTNRNGPAMPNAIAFELQDPLLKRIILAESKKDPSEPVLLLMYFTNKMSELNK